MLVIPSRQTLPRKENDMKSWFKNDKGSWTNPHPDGSVDTLPWLVLFILLLIILNPLMYIIGKEDGRVDAMSHCNTIIKTYDQIWEATLGATILLDRIEREHGIVCDGATGVCTQTDPVTP